MKTYSIKTTNDSGSLGFVEPKNWLVLDKMRGICSLEDWKPLQVVTEKYRGTHFIYGGTHIFCSAAAKELLSPHIAADVEFLPVYTEDPTKPDFFHIHIVAVLENAFDREHSKYMIDPHDSSRVVHSTAVFHEEIVGDHFLFRVPEIRVDEFATERFKNLAEHLQLTSLRLVMVPGSK